MVQEITRLGKKRDCSVSLLGRIRRWFSCAGNSGDRRRAVDRILPIFLGGNRGMTDRLLTRPEVEGRCGIARSTIYRLMRSGRFPKSIRISPGAVRWRESEIIEWIGAQPIAKRGP